MPIFFSREARQREKDEELKAREYRELKRIETAQAKKRMKAGKADPPVNLPEGKGDARDIAAAAVSWSGKTAEKAERMLDRIDALIEEGVGLCCG